MQVTLKCIFARNILTDPDVENISSFSEQNHEETGSWKAIDH